MNGASWTPPAPRSTLRKMYWDQGMSVPEIAAHFGCSKNRIYTAFKRFGISRRKFRGKNFREEADE